jgi:predicted kinase
MRPVIIIITGRPAAGKSTLAKWLSKELQISVVSKDSIREELFERLGWKDREWAQLLGKASVDMMFYFAKAELAVGHSIIMDNTFNPILSVPRFNDLKNQYKADSIQIICNTDNKTLFERFKARYESGNRHPGHGDETVLNELWEFLISDYLPQLDIGGSVIEVDTTDFSKIEYQTILEQVKALSEK